MAENWPWESMHNTQSGSSQEAKAVVEEQQQEQEQQRPSLVETLQTCLATTTSLLTPSGDVSTVASAALRQQQQSRTVMKRRSRASRRVPTTVVEATSSDFKETVHRLTGIAPPTTPTTPVRPQPKRAGPVNFIRPVPQVQPVPVPLPGPPAAFWPHFDPFIKNEPSQTVISAPFRTASSPIQTWWDAGLQESFSHSSMSPSTVTTTTTTGPFDVSTSSGAPIDPDLSIDDWFQHGSEYMH